MDSTILPIYPKTQKIKIKRIFDKIANMVNSFEENMQNIINWKPSKWKFEKKMKKTIKSYSRWHLELSVSFFESKLSSFLLDNLDNDTNTVDGII